MPDPEPELLIMRVAPELSFAKQIQFSDRFILSGFLLEPGQDNPGIFNCSLDLAQEHDGLATVDQPMVIGQGDVHHWPDDDLKMDPGPVRYVTSEFNQLSYRSSPVRFWRPASRTSRAFPEWRIAAG